MTAIEVAELVVRVVQIYLGVGLAFALVFVAALVPRVDPAAKGSTIGFRLIIIPGCAMLWPLLLLRVIRKTPRPIERNAHRLPILQEDDPG